MIYVKFNTLDDSASRAELIEKLFERDYEDVPIIGKTYKNWLVMGVAFIDGSIRLYHDYAEEFGEIVAWTFAEDPTVIANEDPK